GHWICPFCLLCADPNLPRPSISLSPTWVTAPGTDVTIRCQGQRRDMRFFLHKAADLNPQQHMDPAGTRAEFRIPTMSWQHGGNYSCSYRPRSEPFISSEPSDTVELVVTGEGLSLASPLPAPPSEGRHPDGMLRARVPVLRVPLPLSVVMRTRVGVLGLLPSSSPGGQRLGPPLGWGPWARTLVLFPQRELTQPSLERRRLPPAWAARGQVLGLGGNLLSHRLWGSFPCGCPGGGTEAVLRGSDCPPPPTDLGGERSLLLRHKPAANGAAGRISGHGWVGGGLSSLRSSQEQPAWEAGYQARWARWPEPVWP
uniref:Ig-like domain-containing protein n=1 Tax=Chrysemys picta bellii TaxID=8478 RepID=A0A8C3F5D9_CHRPI